MLIIKLIMVTNLIMTCIFGVPFSNTSIVIYLPFKLGVW